MFLFLISCEKKNEEIVAKRAEIIGNIKQFNEFGYSLTTSDIIQIIVCNSVFADTTENDIKGHFNFKQIPSGVYSIIYFKEGKYHYESQSHVIVAGDEPNYLYEELTEKSQSELKLENIVYGKNASAFFIGNISNKNVVSGKYKWDNSILLRYFISSKSNVSIDNYEFTACIRIKPDDKGDFSEHIDGFFKPFGLEELYIICYPCTSPDHYYQDFKTNKTIYWDLGYPSDKYKLSIPTN
jgi:hypothetical protein